MRATATRSSIRKGKGRLLETCAIAAGMMALAHGGPVLAQGVMGAGEFVLGGAGATISPPAAGTGGANTTQVNTTAAQTIINWTPTDTGTDPATGGIDFLPAGNTLSFYGTGQYVVLNRFVGPAAAVRPVGLNGTVNAFVGSPFSTAGNPQGGNIWFYNAGGILIGATAAINVGSLVLTANDIDTSGGLFSGPGGSISFRGAPGSTASVEIAGGAAINAGNGTPGNSYVAMVAPRVVQRGVVTVDGSTAYVAAEQADITINNGLFDINVLVGAEGGTVIDHSGTTTGPSHIDSAPGDNRVYMVAIPKNDAVTMLVSGQIGYEDAASVEVDPNGAVVLAAGYNVEDGLIGARAGGTDDANITVNDTLFTSSVTAHASNDFVGQPLDTIPVDSGGSASVEITPPHIGNLVVEGDGVFIGDASATLNIGAAQLVGATGDFTVMAGGIGGLPGDSAVNVTGGQLSVGGTLTVDASGSAGPDGSATGGAALLSVTGGNVTAGGVAVSAAGVGAIDGDGNGGNGTGGTASLLVSGSGATLAANQIDIDASGMGGGVTIAPGGVTAGDIGGSGVGGTANVTVQNGGSLTANTLLSVNAGGVGETGRVQSGDGTGGAAGVTVTGAGSSITSATTSVGAGGTGGGFFSVPILGDIVSQNGGDGTGGDVALAFNGDSSTAVVLGNTTIFADGEGGAVLDTENGVGGDGAGGTVDIDVDGGMAVEFDRLIAGASGFGGGGESPSNATALSGNSQGGTVTVDVTNSSTLLIDGDIFLSAESRVSSSENAGTGNGGAIVVNATAGGTISALGSFGADVLGGAQSAMSFAISSGDGNGGDIGINADGGFISVGQFSLTADGITRSVEGAGGIARGGTIDLIATNNGRIEATDIFGFNSIDARAQTGSSIGGMDALGGSVQLIADGGTIAMTGFTYVSADGVTGADDSFSGIDVPVGLGGTVLIRVVDNGSSPSAMSFDNLFASANGSASLSVESGFGDLGSGNGQGGSMIVEIDGGTFDADSVSIAADGFGGGVGPASGTGRGGTTAFTQNGGDATIANLVVTADGNGGFALDVSGDGFGGDATINLFGGTLTATDIAVAADGRGGEGAFGDDFSAPIIPAGDGGRGQGGTATINLDGTAVVDAQTILASAAGRGGEGGDFFSSGGAANDTGSGGEGEGGDARINIVAGTLTTGDLIADAGGFGGRGGELSVSSSSGIPIGTGVGGNGGRGQGGTATIEFLQDVVATGTVASYSNGVGGEGAFNAAGGNGGEGSGGLAQVIVTNYEAGALEVIVDAAAMGGGGGDGSNGPGGDGGFANGGIARVQTNGPNASATVSQANFVTDGTGGNGGSASLQFGNDPAAGPAGGNGGDGTGGTLDVIASSGSTVSLAVDTGGVGTLSSVGTGGNGGSGANNMGTVTLPGPDGLIGTPDDVTTGLTGGDGGIAGAGIGGTVHLLADGGTVTSNGGAVNISASGTSGNGGEGGGGMLANGGCCSGVVDQGGTVIVEALTDGAGPGQIAFGDTVIATNGFTAGRIEIITDGNITMSSLTAEALGVANPTNNDTDTAPRGIFLATTDGTIQTDGDVSVATGSSVGIYAQVGGQVNVGGSLTIDAADQIDIRHDFGDGSVPTIQTGGGASFLAVNSIRSAPGSLVSAGSTLFMNATGINSAIDVDSLAAASLTLLLATDGRINVYGTTTSGDDLTANAGGEVAINEANGGDDISLIGGNLTLGTLTTDASGFDSELDGSGIFLQSTGAATVGHAEASNDFTALVGSFATGLNSIITGGDIQITAPGGAVDLGNSEAGGSVTVTGQSIAFNDVLAGSIVTMQATGSEPGLEGISGSRIVAGDTVDLFANSIQIADSIVSSGSVFGFALGGDANLSATADGDITIVAIGDLNGGFVSGGNVNLNADGDIDAQATASGGFINPFSSQPSEGHVFASAGGSATLTDSAAATMLGVQSGAGTSITGSTAGEDVFVFAGTTATLDGVTAGDDINVDAPDGILVSGAITTGAGPDNRSVILQSSSSSPGGFLDIATTDADLSNITLNTSAGAITASDVSAFDNVTMTAAQAATATGLVQSGLATSVTGSALSFEAITAGTDIDLTAASGGVTATGALAAGHDLNIDAVGDVTASELDAGDDVTVSAEGALTIGAAYSFGTGLDNESDGSNIVLQAGATDIGHAEANDDFIADVATFQTGFETIITGGDIDISAIGAADLGNSIAGGSIAVTAQRIDFAALDAGSDVSLFANDDAAGAEGIRGGSITAGETIDMTARSITLDGAVIAGRDLFAITTGGAATFATVETVRRIQVESGADISGDFESTGDISLFAANNINGSARALGGAPDSDGIPYSGNLFIIGSGDVTLTDSSAARMFGVYAGGVATLTGASAGEDMSVIAALDDAALSNITVGDDLTVDAAGTIDVQNAVATGTGPDANFLAFDVEDGFTLSSGEGGSASDGADIVLSAGGAINAAALSAGDDIVLTATTNLALSGASTLGLGQTGGGSHIETQSIDAVLAGIDAHDDVIVNATGTARFTAPAIAGRDISVTADAAEFANLSTPLGAVIDVIDAGRDVTITASEAVTGGSMVAGRDFTVESDTSITIDQIDAAAGNVALFGDGDVMVSSLASGGTTDVTSDNGIIMLAGLTSAGPISASGNSVQIVSNGSLIFASLVTTAGDANIRSSGNLSITSGSVAGTADLDADNNLSVTQLVAADAILEAGSAMTLTDATVDNSLIANAHGMATVNGVITGPNLSVTSGDISVSAAGRLGTLGVTESLQVLNGDEEVQTFVGGTASRAGYHIDADELTRLFGTEIRIFAPEVRSVSGGSVGSSAPPDVIVDDFVMTGGSSTSNLGANGSLSIETPGKMRVIGDAQLTGLTDENALDLFADDALEVLLGEGSIRLVNGSTPTGSLNLFSDDVIVATSQAIQDVAAATSTDAIDSRLAQNDSITSNDGALFAGGINASVSGGFYVQNSGAGTAFGERRGLTFGALGLTVDALTPDVRIVVNGVHLGSSGQVTGLDVIPLLTINGSSSSAGSFDPRSTLNGCPIANPAACGVPPPDPEPEPHFESSFPVQDVIEEETEAEGEESEGISLPTALITMREVDPLTGEPLLDDPVTGAGNDNLWTPIDGP